MFTIVLAVGHEEDRARKQAEVITDAPLSADECRVVIVHVSQEVRSDEGNPIDMQNYSEIPESIQLARDHLGNAGLSVDIKRETGEPADEVLRTARNLEADWIVIGEEKRSPVGKAVFGSVSQDIILNTNCSVLVVKDK